MNLIVADLDIESASDIVASLRRAGFSIGFARNGSEIVTRVAEADVDNPVVLLDITAPDEGGIAQISMIRSRAPGASVIALANVSSPEAVVAAVRAGATDFLLKPVTDTDLIFAVRNSAAFGGRAREPNRPVWRETFQPRDPKMRTIQAALKEIALSDAPVLLRGESGVGKEILAREIHARSSRRTKPFIRINCAALPGELIESELFGYERGAFTGAATRKWGQFEAAGGGTILLDEIGDMELRLQAKLLHVLQDHEFHRLGGTEPVRVDVRVLAATHCDLEDAIRQRRFREDLYYRLNVVTIRVPSLRERPEDILPLTEFLISKHAAPGTPMPPITPALKDALLSHNWPGNVRELENVARRLLVFGDAAGIANELDRKAGKRSLPGGDTAAARAREGSLGRSNDASRQQSTCPPVVALDELRATDDRHEAAAITAALYRTEWHRKKAAVLLNIGYKRLLYRMRKLGIEREAYPSVSPQAVSKQAGEHHSSAEDDRGTTVLTLDNVRVAREQSEADAIIDALNRTRWNRRRAAALLNVGYKGLLYRMRKLGISRSQPLKPAGSDRPGFDGRVAL